jgi:hypothetical protein
MGHSSSQGGHRRIRIVRAEAMRRSSLHRDTVGAHGSRDGRSEMQATGGSTANRPRLSRALLSARVWQAGGAARAWAAGTSARRDAVQGALASASRQVADGCRGTRGLGFIAPPATGCWPVARAPAELHMEGRRPARARGVSRQHLQAGPRDDSCACCSFAATKPSPGSRGSCWR